MKRIEEGKIRFGDERTSSGKKWSSKGKVGETIAMQGGVGGMQLSWL